MEMSEPVRVMLLDRVLLKPSRPGVLHLGVPGVVAEQEVTFEV